MDPGNSTLILSLSFLSAGFLGSWHCGFMCGPFATQVAAKKKLFIYHLGRGISYSTLGLFAGFTGNYFLENSSPYLKFLGYFIFSLSLFLFILNSYQQSGVAKSIKHLFLKLFFKQKKESETYIKLNTPYPKLIYFLFNKAKDSAFLLGLFSIFLPCGWLYGFVISAASSKSPFAGALIMFLFALSSIPALSAVPMLIQKTLPHLKERQKKMALSILTLASVYALLSHLIGFNH